MRSLPNNRRGARADIHAGRRVALALEALGEALVEAPGLPPRFHSLAKALAEGRSTVPVDDGPDFVARVRARMTDPTAEPALAGWLGRELAVWVGSVAALPVHEAAEVAVEARGMLSEPLEPIAHAYSAWFAAGLSDGARPAFGAASKIALAEACDRWCALGCEGDLARYVVTWQRSAAGWAEAALGQRSEVSVCDLGRLRELSAAVAEMAARADEAGVSAALAARLGWPRAEVERLLKVGEAVRTRTDPREVLRRRWSIVGPIAQAVASLERDLGRLPSLPEIAARAGVHETTVELALEALEDG